MSSIVLRSVDEKMRKDTGMALTLICLLIGFAVHAVAWFIAAAIVCVLTMLAPPLFTWPAKVWFGFSMLIGTVVSRILLTVVFFLIVTPIGLVRKLTGADPLMLNKWKQGHGSVFTERNHRFLRNDLENPF